MKTKCIAKLLLSLALAACLPVSAQSTAQLKQENERLKAQLQALQAQGCTPAAPVGANWANGALDARLDAIRIGRLGSSSITEVTVTMTLRNSGTTPLILNYLATSLSVTDDHGYHYEMYAEKMNPTKTIKGIPTSVYNRGDTSSVLSPGASRTVTFIANRSMKNGQTPGDRFDINATFVQFEDLGQGRIRKVRDYPVAFTNVARSGSGISQGNNGNPVPQAVGQAVDRVLGRILK